MGRTICTGYVGFTEGACIPITCKKYINYTVLRYVYIFLIAYAPYKDLSSSTFSSNGNIQADSFENLQVEGNPPALSQMSTYEPRIQKTYYFPLNPGCLIGIPTSWDIRNPIIKGCITPPISPYKTTRGHGPFFHCSYQVGACLVVLHHLNTPKKSRLETKIKVSAWRFKGQLGVP